MTWFNASRLIGWSVSLLTATVSRWRRKMKMRWSDAPDAHAVSGGRSGNRRSILVRKHTELGVVAQRRETGARGDQIAGDVGGMLVACHAEAIDQQTVQCLVIRQPASANLVADDRSEYVEAAVDVAVHRTGDGGHDRALCRFERVARILIDRAILEAERHAPVAVRHGKGQPGAHAQQMVERDQTVDF